MSEFDPLKGPGAHLPMPKGLSPQIKRMLESLPAHSDLRREKDKNTPELLLYIEPRNMASAEPVIDEITTKMTAAFKEATGTEMHWRGFHHCVCGSCSDDTDYILPSGHQTNSLAVHYVAFHRNEVPEEQLDIISKFAIEPAEPTAEDMNILTLI
jgi:hypothetical protein